MSPTVPASSILPDTKLIAIITKLSRMLISNLIDDIINLVRKIHDLKKDFLKRIALTQIKSNEIDFLFIQTR